MTIKNISLREAYNSPVLQDLYVATWSHTDRADVILHGLHETLRDYRLQNVFGAKAQGAVREKPPTTAVFQAPIDAFHFVKDTKQPIRSMFFEVDATPLMGKPAQFGQNAPNVSPVEEYSGLNFNTAIEAYLSEAGITQDHPAYASDVAFAYTIIQAYNEVKSDSAPPPALFLIDENARSQPIAQLLADLTGRDIHLVSGPITMDRFSSIEQIKAQSVCTKPKTGSDILAKRFGLGEAEKTHSLYCFERNDFSGIRFTA